MRPAGFRSDLDLLQPQPQPAQVMLQLPPRLALFVQNLRRIRMQNQMRNPVRPNVRRQHHPVRARL